MDKQIALISAEALIRQACKQGDSETIDRVSAALVAVLGSKEATEWVEKLIPKLPKRDRQWLADHISNTARNQHSGGTK